MFTNLIVGALAKFSFTGLKEFILDKRFLVFIFLVWILWFVNTQQQEYNALLLNKNKLTTELSQLEINLGSAKARLANMQKEKELSDSLYIDIRDKYSSLDSKLDASKQTIKKLRETKGSPDDKILEMQITSNIADVANGRVLPNP